MRRSPHRMSPLHRLIILLLHLCHLITHTWTKQTATPPTPAPPLPARQLPVGAHEQHQRNDMPTSSGRLCRAVGLMVSDLTTAASRMPSS
ncbi:MAG: hypothetical protein R2911_31195 [Caldilineaceae bacterium]